MKWIEIKAKSEGYRNVLNAIFGVTCRIHWDKAYRPNMFVRVVIDDEETRVKGWDLSRFLWDAIIEEKEELDELLDKLDLEVEELEEIVLEEDEEWEVVETDGSNVVESTIEDFELTEIE